MYGISSIDEISAPDLAQRLPEEELQLVDVREPDEVAIANLPNFIHLPLSQYADWSDHILNHLDPSRETIVMCHHGMRSAQMCQWLKRQGFERTKNLSGGIDAYARLVDSTIPRY
ncbi:rhodanese-like domain-containing protein [Leptothoe sp. PORK10 BA2]|uniref:rhodanese-like domain-containing protein n=1 Tax=Leptothoe sp. PORK10 BA2 TaxID=3110254 RepID=UPI002B1FEDE4|nr:rhodanese-like domain-containing protein [Leptothoe sp. PORK10 BA2]MEA5463123.1 rhodanese-like domain-containing protein [Leptothoe sp. PORK10 BA2]